MLSHPFYHVSVLHSWRLDFNLITIWFNCSPEFHTVVCIFFSFLMLPWLLVIDFLSTLVERKFLFLFSWPCFCSIYSTSCCVDFLMFPAPFYKGSSKEYSYGEYEKIRQKIKFGVKLIQLNIGCTWWILKNQLWKWQNSYS